MKEARCETGWRLSSSGFSASLSNARESRRARERKTGRERDARRDAVDARKGGGVAEREEERKIGGALRGNGRPWTDGQWTWLQCNSC